MIVRLDRQQVTAHCQLTDDFYVGQSKEGF